MNNGIIKSLILVGVVTTTAFAGQIKVGTGANGGNGLTGTAAGQYMASAANCVGASFAQAGFTACTAPVLTLTNGIGQRNYSPFLWQGTLPSQAGPNGETAGLLQTGTDGITYAMVNNGSTTCTAAGDGGCNFWSLRETESITIPIGVFGVTKAHLGLNDYWGLIGAQNTQVFLDFNTASDGSGAATTVQFNLTNGVEIRSATDCAPSIVSGPCTTVARTATSANTFNLYTSSYTNNTVATGLYNGTNGSVNLDVLAFSVAAANQARWLVDIRVGNVGGGNNISRTALTAITLETSSVPEPSTVLMLLGGLGVLGYARKRATKVA